MKKQAEPRLGEFVDLREQEDVRAHLMRPDLHWKAGRSAAELAHAWWEGVPRPVSVALASDSALASAKCERVVFEKRTQMPAAGGSTRSDLVAYFDASGESVVAAVEGKAGESLGPICSDWLHDGTSPRSPDNRRRRLEELCRLLGTAYPAVGDLSYQLLVRSAAALREAEASGAARAIMLVHSFDPDARGAADFFRFAGALGAPVEGFDRLSPGVHRAGVMLQVGWARDAARS